MGLGRDWEESRTIEHAADCKRTEKDRRRVKLHSGFGNLGIK